MWSLSVEMAFYLLFPLACAWLRRDARLLALAALLIVAGPDVYKRQGLFLPILRFFHQHQVDPGVLAIIRANVREPEQVEGDLYALVACNDIGGRRLKSLLTEFQLADLESLGGYIIEQSAQALSLIHI